MSARLLLVFVALAGCSSDPLDAYVGSWELAIGTTTSTCPADDVGNDTVQATGSHLSAHALGDHLFVDLYVYQSIDSCNLETRTGDTQLAVKEDQLCSWIRRDQTGTYAARTWKIAYGSVQINDRDQLDLHLNAKAHTPEGVDCDDTGTFLFERY